MIKSLVKPSAIFLAFILSLKIDLSQPQMKHLLRIGESIILCEGKKTLSNLYRIILDAPDVSAAADFLRESPWNYDDVRKSIEKFTIVYMLDQNLKYGKDQEIIISLDDSTTRKDKDTSHMDAVSWHFDHSGSGKGQTSYCKGVVHLNLRVQIGQCGFTFTWRLYLRQKQIRKLNKNRTKGEKLRFKSKNTLAKEMLKEIIPYIPDDYKVYVLFDRWYTSANLIKYIRRQGWHVIGAIKSNRKVNGIQIKKWPELLRNKRYIKAKYIATDGTTKQFFVRRIEGKLSSIDEDICVLISKRHNREKNSKYFICTDRNLSTNKILNLYSKRWPIEVEYWYLKEYLGLGDFRVQSYNAISKWYTIVYLVLTFLQWRLYETDIQDSSIKSVADVIHKHRREHIVELIRYICKKIMGGYTDMDFLINHFIAGS